MLSFAKLWILLENKGMKKTDLKEIISGNTLAKLGKNETVSSVVIEKICAFLDCQPGDIMEYISDKKKREVAQQIDSANRAIMENLKAQGITEEQFASMFSQVMPEIIKGMFSGENVMENIMNEAIKEDE